MKNTKPGYYVCDGNRDDKRLRGPFVHEETAGAVRTEMERGDEYDQCNLCVRQIGYFKDEATTGKEMVASLVKAWPRDGQDLAHWVNKLREWAGIPA